MQRIRVTARSRFARCAFLSFAIRRMAGNGWIRENDEFWPVRWSTPLMGHHEFISTGPWLQGTETSGWYLFCVRS